MSEKISEVTESTTLADADLFALAKWTGSGPTGYASRHVSAANLVTELTTNNQTFITNIVNNEDFITELTENEEFITNIVESDTYVTNQAAVLRTTVEEETGVTYTLILADADHKWKRFTNASDILVTVPAFADVPWPDNTYIELEQGGNGAVTVEGDVGVTVNYNENLTNVLNGNFAVAGLKYTGLNEWTLFGNLVPA